MNKKKGFMTLMTGRLISSDKVCKHKLWLFLNAIKNEDI